MIYLMKAQIRNYLARIGKQGGKKSRRTLSTATAREMVRLREARRAFRRYYASCFWSTDPTYVIMPDDVRWCAEQLMQHGNREAWEIGVRLCR